MKTHRIKERSLGGDMCYTLCGQFIKIEGATTKQSDVTCGSCVKIWQKRYNRQPA